MIKLYQSIDNNILKKAPFQWIVGWHKFLPIIAILVIFSIAIGFMFPTTTYNYYNNKGLEIASVSLGFVSFMVFILYIVRQIKFNSFRIHHHIPFAKNMYIYFSFWTLITLLAYIPFIPHHIHNWRVTKTINNITDDFKKDTKILYEGSVFFVSDYSRNNVKHIIYDDVSEEAKQHFEVEFNDDFVTINNIDHQFGYFYQYTDESFRLPITISKGKAINRINNFTKVASKYNIELTENDAELIYNKRKEFNQGKSNQYNFSLFKSSKTDDTFFSAVNKYDGMMYSYQRHYNKEFDFEVLLGILMFSIVLAILLWIVISIPIADFGYSIIVSVVLMVFMGIISALINLLTSNDFIIRLAFYIAIFVVYFFAFVFKKDTRLHRVLKIVSHYLVAVFLFLLFLEFAETDIIKHKNEFYAFSLFFLFGIIISVFLFKQVYRNYRLLPK